MVLNVCKCPLFRGAFEWIRVGVMLQVRKTQNEQPHLHQPHLINLPLSPFPSYSHKYPATMSTPLGTEIKDPRRLLAVALPESVDTLSKVIKGNFRQAPSLKISVRGLAH